MEKITILLDDTYNKKVCYNCAQIIIEDATGFKKEKVVSIESLIEAFSESLINNEAVRIGKIPFGYYDGKINLFQETFTAEVVIVMPPQKQIMIYEKTKFDVCIPALTFWFHVKDSRLYETKVFALKDKTITDETNLYVYPFGNVNPVSGVVCWGNNQLPSITQLKNLEEMTRLFIQSPCNEDYYSSKNCCGKENYPLRQLFQELELKESYPESYLVPIPKHVSKRRIGDLIS